MSLTEYHRKRHFTETPEPAGKFAGAPGSLFVIQKHDATRLHYDFRLELDGVLKSWAVPKGPSLDPSVKRLAVHVEDHPVEYGSFEGIIPEGNYGAGPVLLWDRGTWEPIGDAHEGYRKGRLKFVLHGEKLRGRWMLVRSGGSRSAHDEKQWLIFKERDDDARPSGDEEIVDELPLSVNTGRSIEEIAANVEATPKTKSHRNRKSKPAKSIIKTRRRKSTKSKSTRAPAMPQAQLATLADSAPDGNEWLHEIKFDGYRMLCRIANGRAEFISRNSQNWTGRLSNLTDQVQKLPVQEAILDGEVVALRPNGETHFQDLQNAFRKGKSDSLHYFVFDLLHLDGKNLMALPLIERKGRLQKLLAGKNTPLLIRYSEHIEGNGSQFYREVVKRGLEGIISKRKDKPYQPGRGLDWLKIKASKQEEFIIGGFTEPSGARSGFGALLVGYFDKSNRLIYAGRVGTGFGGDLLDSLSNRLGSLERQTSPFADFRSSSEKIHWVKPQLVAQITFASWTNDKLLRHASFQGLREDKPAKDVARDEAISKARTVKKSSRSRTKEEEYVTSKQEFAGVRLTSPDKILYPDSGITKLDLANYYRATADWMMPHIENRPLVLTRCPDGLSSECFYQKHPSPGTPENLHRIAIKEKNKTADYVVVDDGADLISLAQIGALEIHAWGSRTDRLEYPDRLIFDLDPDPSVSWKDVVRSARQVREFLLKLGLESFVKTTGGKGLHLVVPIDRRHDWKVVRPFCGRIAELIVSADPNRYTAKMSKAARVGKIFIDYLRNDRGATAIVPYSTRAKAGGPVAVPLAWSELSDRIRSDHYTIRTLSNRLSALKRDPWEKMLKLRQGLAGPLKTLQEFSHSPFQEV